MKKQTFKQQLLTSVVCSAVLGLIVACGGSGHSNLIIQSGEALVSHLFHNSQAGLHSHIVPTSTANQPIVAAFFQTAAPVQSDTPESFEVTCDFPPGFVSGVPLGSIVPFAPTNNGVDQNNCSFAVSQAQPAGIGGLSIAQPLFHPGTIQTLVVTGLTSGGAQVRCSDLTTRSPGADKDFVVPYFNPQSNAISMFNNVTQLSFSCSLDGVPAGDTVARLTARWTKL
jgi:hypothetical protein